MNDNTDYIEFLSETDFISSSAQKHFTMSWKQDGNYDGSTYQHLKSSQTHPILTCALSAIKQLKEYGAITVLITGESSKNLHAKGSKAILEKSVDVEHIVPKSQGGN